MYRENQAGAAAKSCKIIKFALTVIPGLYKSKLHHNTARHMQSHR